MIVAASSPRFGSARRALSWIAERTRAAASGLARKTTSSPPTSPSAAPSRDCNSRSKTPRASTPPSSSTSAPGWRAIRGSRLRTALVPVLATRVSGIVHVGRSSARSVASSAVNAAWPRAKSYISAPVSSTSRPAPRRSPLKISRPTSTPPPRIIRE